MNVENDISEELRLLSAVVAAISRQTPYAVPEGYFTDLSARVLRQVSKPLTFSVPEGYFEGFARQVLDKIKSGAGAASDSADAGGRLGASAGTGATLGVSAGDGGKLNVSADADKITERSEGNRGSSEARPKVAGEAQREGGGASVSKEPGRDEPWRSSPDEALGDDPYSSILAEAGRRTPYSVPNGYFEANAPVLCVARAKNPYTVPADYFEGQVPLLAIARDNPYTVPAGYFDEQATAGRVAAAMKDAVVAGGATVIDIGVRRMSWLKYAAAAVVAGFIVTVGLLRIHTARDKQIVPIDIAKTMSTVSDQELQNFLTVQGASFGQPEQGASPRATATVGVNDNDLKTLLGDVPDGELKQYMEEHGGADDIATN